MKRLEQVFASLGVARRFLPELRSELGKLSVLGGLSLGAVALDLLRPWPIKWIVDQALVPVDSPSFEASQVILFGAAAAAAIAGVRALAQYWREMGLARTELQLTRRLRFKVFSHMALLSPGYHARHKSGDLLVRLMGDAPMVSTMIVNSFLDVTTKSLFIVATVVVMTVLDPLLTAVTFVVAPIVLFLVRSASSRIHVAVRKQRRKEGDLADYLHEAIAATETIQAIGGSDEVVRRFARSNRKTARAGLKAKRIAARLSASIESLLGIGLAIVLALGSFRVVGGHLTTGELLVFLSYVRTLSKPIRSASKHTGKIAKGTACGERLIAVMDEVPEVMDAPSVVPPPETPERLTFDDVHYSFEGSTPALDGLDVSFERGQLSALVGRSGAGKSTAASLAMRLMDPDEGHVLLDDLPLTAFGVNDLRAKIGLCLQRTMLFGESIRENLLLAAPDVTEEDMWAALRRAGADDFVAELERGLDTELGSSGVGLSGGQLSRLSVARTLLRDAAVLIVDEPFAGLDRVATRKLSATLRTLAQDRIVIAIAHDFEDIQQYDHIVFIDSGRVVDEGTHTELADRLPMYREVVRTTEEVRS